MSEKESVVKPVVDESTWKEELRYLDTLLTGRLTESEAKNYAKSEQAKHDGVVKAIEKQIAQARSVLSSDTTSFLPSADRKRIADRIESLEFELATAKKLREQSILKCGAGIRTAKETDKLRDRWQELCDRQRKIGSALNIARGRERELGVTIPRRWVG